MVKGQEMEPWSFQMVTPTMECGRMTRWMILKAYTLMLMVMNTEDPSRQAQIPSLEFFMDKLL